MSAKSIVPTIVAVTIVLTVLTPPTLAVTDPADPNRYLHAVREFADNVLKYGRDTYGPKHTPLFVDGLNIRTHEPAKWINSNGKKWILSNLASQQTLLRTLDGLSKVTGDPKYRKAAEEAVRYAFDHLRSPNGLFYWGHYVAYDAQADEVKFPSSKCHILKLHYPYYELMWQVDPNTTKQFIEAFWSAHVIDWSNLDFNRIAYYSDTLEQPWNHEYKGTPVFFKANGGGFFTTGSSLIQAGTTLYRLSGQEDPLVWSKRLAKRFVDVRHPKTGISTCLYNNLPPRQSLGDGLKDHFQDPHTRVFPFAPFEETRGTYYPDNVEAHDWASFFLVGETLGDRGGEFTKWALEELTAWGKASYRKKDNSFVPILTDGTSIEGYVAKERNSYGPKGAVAKPLFANLGLFWTYAIGSRTTGDEFMWEMTRDIVLGNSLGDIGRRPVDPPELEMGTTCSDVYGLLGFLELYDKTGGPSFLQMARRIGHNILATQFHKGFFVASKKHVYTRFDCFEPLALLRLLAAVESQSEAVPQLWPSCPLFVPPYRYKQLGVDRLVIYDLTELPELPLSLQEAAAIGDVGLIQSLLAEGVGVDSWDDSLRRTALQHAAMRGHKAVVELLIDKGADINAKEDWPGGTALHYAAEHGHKEVAELLIAKGADVNAARTYPAQDRPLHSAARAGHRAVVELLIQKGADVNAEDDDGETPLDVVGTRSNKEITSLLVSKGAIVSSIHVATKAGDIACVKMFLEEDADINAKDKNGQTALHIASGNKHKDIAELLINKGADVNAKDKGEGKTALFYAVENNQKDIVGLLLAEGADVNAKEEDGYSPLYYALSFGDPGMVELLVSKGADINHSTEVFTTPLHYAVRLGKLDIVKILVNSGAKLDVVDQDGWTVLRRAVNVARKDMVELLMSKGADVSGLHKAACVGDLARVKNYIEQRADVNTQDELGWTPLYWAASLRQTEVAKLLIDKGADVRTAATDGRITLHQAAQAGDNELIELLLSKGADIQAKTKRGSTPLHSAASAGRQEAVELLIAKGAEINARTTADRTPLHNAVLGNHKAVVELLIKAGADV